MPTYDVELTRYKNIPQFANLKITASDHAEARKIAENLWDDAATTWSDYGETYLEQNDLLVLGESK